MSVWFGCFSCKKTKTQSKTKNQKLSPPSQRKRKQDHRAWILRTQRYLTKYKGANVIVLPSSLKGLEPESGSPLCLTLSFFCYGFFCCSNLQVPCVILQLQPHRETNSTFLWCKLQIPREENLIGSAWIKCPPLVQSAVFKGWRSGNFSSADGMGRCLLQGPFAEEERCVLGRMPPWAEAGVWNVAAGQALALTSQLGL